MTKREFRKAAARVFLGANPGATIDWLEARFVTWPTGLKGWHGKFMATKPGYKPTAMIANWDAANGMLVH